SEFALRHAHELVGDITDGQLYADLGGREPAGTGAVLSGFLQALGVMAEHVPGTLDQRLGLYRSLLAERRLPGLLGNVHEERQVRPLLAGPGPSVTIVVSRRPLRGLRDAHRVDLGVLPRRDSIAMLSAVASENPSLDRPACDKLAEMCGDLPLALDIAARKLA